MAFDWTVLSIFCLSASRHKSFIVSSAILVGLHKGEILQRRPDGEKRLNLTVNHTLNWYIAGTSIHWAVGLTDIDLSITPSTNMLPIRNHNLKIGGSCEVNCVWVQLPALTLANLIQHYTRIDARHYDYAAPSLNFKAVLSVDEDGMIVKYGDLWHQPGFG